MTTTWKVVLGVSAALVVAGGVFGGIHYSKRGIVTVQTGHATRQDLVALVTASGEIKPRNYINVGTNAAVPSQITQILVVEGQQVKKGQLLAKLESVQQEADLAAQKASVDSAEADSAAAEASLKAADDNIRLLQVSVERAKTDFEKARIVYDRTNKLFEARLIAQQDYDQRKLEMESLAGGTREAEARLIQARAQRAQYAASLGSAQKRVALSMANLRRVKDVVDRTSVISPIDGMVTNLPVRVGETVVPGIQNSSSSLIMTIADMSLITSEVKVDESDIVNVKLDQAADVTIDAMPGRTVRGKVIEIGNTAILRSTGVAASQSAISSQEAKDFKVVVALVDPPADLRPGLSSTAKIITARRQKVLTIPIQALTVRQKGDLDPVKEGVQAAAKPDPAEEKAKKEEIQGVFVIQGQKAVFRKVATGISGATDIEALDGVNDGDEIITGSYKAIRTLRNEAKIKVDNKAPVKTES